MSVMVARLSISQITEVTIFYQMSVCMARVTPHIVDRLH